MGFSFLHRYIFGDNVIHPIQKHVRQNKKLSKIYFDCTGLLYQTSYSLPTEVIMNNVDSLLNSIVESIMYYIKIVKELTASPVLVFLFFDGKSPKHKLYLQRKRDKIIQRSLIAKKQTLGLSMITDRNTRSEIVSYVSNNIVGKISQECENVHLFTTEQPGEADIKIVKTILNSESNDSVLEVIVTADTDIFISLNSLRKRDILILIRLPRVGLHCLTSHSINNWLDNNSICYKRLLFYFVFFCGNDYECPIISGTKKQILLIYHFGISCNFKVTVLNLLYLWSKLNIKPTKSVIITGLSLNALCQIVRLKMSSVTKSIKYYSFGCDLPNNHVAVLSIFYKWRILLKNIHPKDIDALLRQIKSDT